MRFLPSLFLFLLVAQPATGQALIDTLAARVCDCMQDAPEIIYPRLQARRCVDDVSRGYTSRIWMELFLSTDRPDDRRRLTELLIEPLAIGCPMLQDFAPGRGEPELHYSDFPLARAANRKQTAKHPLPDLAATTTQEGRDVFRISGTLLLSSTGDTLPLRLESGSIMEFVLPSRQLRRVNLTVGQALTVTYRYDWQTDEKRATAVVIALE